MTNDQAIKSLIKRLLKASPKGSMSHYSTLDAVAKLEGRLVA